MSLSIPKIKERIKTSQHTLVYIGLGVIAFFLSIHFSQDWIWYVANFDYRIAITDWAALLTSINIFQEPLYIFSAKMFGQIVGYPAFIFFATVTLLTLKLQYLREITNSLYIGAFFYTCFYLFLLEGTVIRTAYAVAFLMMALYYIRESRLLGAFLLITLASQIHFTAIVFLIVFPLHLFKPLNLYVPIIFVLSPLFIILDIPVLNVIQEIAGMVNPRYLAYFNQSKLLNQNSTGLFLYFIAFFWTTLALIFYYLKESIRSDKFLQTVFLITLSGIVVMCVFNDYVALAARLGELLLFPIVILLAQLHMHFHLKKMYIHLVALIILSLMYFSARVVYLYPTMFTG